MRKINNNFNKNRKIISLTQILILLIGILAFSYMLGEIGKQRGIEVSNGIGIVGAQGLEGETCNDKAENFCAVNYGEGALCNKKENRCEAGVKVNYKDEQKNNKEISIPKSEAQTPQSIGNYLSYILTAGQIYEIGGKIFKATEKPGEPVVKVGDKWVKATGSGGVGGTTGGTGEGVWTQVGDKWIQVTDSSLSSKLFMGAGKTNLAGSGTASTMTLNVIGSALAAAGTAALIWTIFKLAGAGQQNLNMIINAGIVGASVGFAASFIAWGVITAATGPVGWVAAAVTAVFMGVWILFSYQNYVSELITYQISAWQPQSGGAKCDECNKLEYGCSKYQCKTFGQGCGIVNNGTKQERCVWENPNDKKYPVIIEDAEISEFPENYNYKKSADVSPPDTGVEITSASKNCIPPFSSLVLGVKTDEPAQCRISSSREKTFELMTKDMDEGALAIEEHTKIIPNSATANNWALNNLVDNSGLPDENNDGVADIEFEITKGNEYEYYIKCKDTNGNENPANFVVKFCIQDKDLTAPIIKGFFVADGSFVQFNTPDVTTEVYTNEPAECKWDFNDKKYDEMIYPMTNCDTTINQATVQGNSCTGTFTGLANGKENKYYIRCQDRSEDKNTNSVSEVYTLKVSSQLVLIDSISVNGKGNNSIIKDARDYIPVDLEIKTSFGAEDGKAKCKYKYLGNWNDMSFEYSGINTQTLWLPEGEYELPISCNDIAGDTDTNSISFKIEKDRDAPIVARAYYDVNNLKVITNEPAECVYTLQQNIGCAYEFKDGTAMSEIGELTHYTSWQAGKKYFIKCKDAFGNRPLLPNQCSIIVKAFESYK